MWTRGVVSASTTSCTLWSPTQGARGVGEVARAEVIWVEREVEEEVTMKTVELKDAPSC